MVLPWQQYSRCHFVSFVMYMYITGAKFEDHCSNISRDILKVTVDLQRPNFSKNFFFVPDIAKISI